MSVHSSSGKKHSLSEQLLHSTIRIQTKLSNGDISTGTGFFYLFDFKEPNLNVPVIVTNKHVIDNSISGNLIFSRMDANNERTSEKSEITIENFSKRWLLHPDSETDLCILPCKPYIQELRKKGIEPHLKFVDSVNIPNGLQWSEFTPLEDVIMIGYPNGIWDEVNNLPILRKGITGTPLSIDYNGRTEFLIDLSVFPGSSGSPVFIFNEGSFSTPRGLAFGSRLFLVGITYAVYQYSASGEIIIEDIPTMNKPITRSLIPNNLGLVIKSTRLKDFENVLLNHFKPKTE
jgi:hypothetical protein